MSSMCQNLPTQSGLDPDFSALRNFLEERVRIYLRRKHQKKSRGYKAYPYSYLYDTLKLFKLPMKAPWTQAAKATG